MLNGDSHADLLPRVIRIARENLRRGDASLHLDADTQLLDGGLKLDSIDIVELIALVEQEFGVELHYDDLDPMHFRTLGTLATVIARRVSTCA